MNDSYLEQKVDIQPPAKLQKYANENFDFYNDETCQEQKFLIGTTNLEKVGKMNLMIGEEIM